MWKPTEWDATTMQKNKGSLNTRQVDKNWLKYVTYLTRKCRRSLMNLNVLHKQPTLSRCREIFHAVSFPVLNRRLYRGSLSVAKSFFCKVERPASSPSFFCTPLRVIKLSYSSVINAHSKFSSFASELAVPKPLVRLITTSGITQWNSTPRWVVFLLPSR